MSENHAFAGAMPAGSPPDRDLIKTARRMGCLYTALSLVETLFLLHIDGMVWRFAYIAIIMAVPTLVLFFKPSRIALGFLTAATVLSAVSLVVIFLIGGGILPALLFIMNTVFLRCFVQGVRAASRLQKAR